MYAYKVLKFLLEKSFLRKQCVYKTQYARKFDVAIRPLKLDLFEKQKMGEDSL